MNNESWDADLEGSGDHSLQGGTDLDEVIERSSLGDAAATSFYQRAVADGEDASDVLALLARLDEEEAATGPGGSTADIPVGGADVSRTSAELGGVVEGLRALRRGCAAHSRTEPQRLELVAIHVHAVLGAQRVALIRALMSHMVFTVRRTSHTVFRSAQRLARYWIDTETLPPPASTPMVSLPEHAARGERPEYEVLDDTALVFDRSLFHGNKWRDADFGSGRFDGQLEVYWPSKVRVDHEMFLRQIRAFTYQVDLSPHTLTTPLTLPVPGGDSSPQYVVGLLWRVVDPKRILRWRHLSFVLLLETVLDEWRAALREEVARKGRIERELRTRIAADSCWSQLGVEVTVQLCGQDRDGPMDRLDDGGLRFLLDAFHDRRRWFAPTFSAHQDPVGEPTLAAEPVNPVSLRGTVTDRSSEVDDLSAAPYRAARTPSYASSAESTGPMPRLT